MKQQEKKIIVFDLDDTLCTRVPDRISRLKGNSRYKNCTPIQSNIDLLNEFAADGYYIIIYTARGMTYYDGDVDAIYHNLFKLTSTQLKKWGVNYDELIMGKLHYDVMIDDKVININGRFVKDNILNLAKGFKHNG